MKLNVRDFGAVGDQSAHDDAAFAKMLASIPVGRSCDVMIPEGHYTLVKDLSVNRQVRFHGEGWSKDASGSVLQFYHGTGLKFLDMAASWSEMDHIGIYGNRGDGVPQTGIQASCPILLDRIFVQGFNSTGILFTGNAQDPIPSSSSSWVVQHSTVENVGGHGICAIGPDANIGLASHCRLITCGGFGACDLSLLGNYWEFLQTATCALGPCYGAFFDDQRSHWLYNYAEGDQPPAYFRSPAMVVGGFPASGITADSNPGWIDHEGLRKSTDWPPFVGYTWPDANMTPQPPFPKRGLSIAYTTEAERVAAVARIAALTAAA
jgi:hypothetical protein